MPFVKRRPLLSASLALIFVVFVVATISFGSKPGGDYIGRILVAGHGGHIADANVIIDPMDLDNPIKIPKYTLWTGNKLHMIPLGSSSDHAVHDVRIDSRDKNTVFWSSHF